MRFVKCGEYGDVKDSGLHLKAVGREKYQSVSRSILREEDYRALIKGEPVEIPFIAEEDLLTKIDS